MKTLPYFLIILFIASIPQINKKDYNIEVILHLDKELSETEQMVYISSFCPWVSGWEQMIWDSVQTRKGQTSIKLHAYSPIEENMFSVMFAKKGPEKLNIYACPKDTVEINVSYKEASTIFKKAIKGDFHNLNVEKVLERGGYWLKKNGFQQLGNKDSLAFYDHILIDSYRADLYTSNHPSIAKQGLSMMRIFFQEQLGTDSIQRMENYLASKFPNYPAASPSYNENKTQTERGIRVAQRLKEIKEQRYTYEKSQQNTQIGSKLNLKLCGLDGTDISLSDLAGNSFVYVDVWATWCKPCRSQFPYIKKALKKYPNDLKVYAISIDTNHDLWRKVIEKDSLQQFTHVIGTNNHAEISYDVILLGIERIPRNFLLDKNLKIIATDLHNDQLLEHLDSLSKKRE